MTEYSKEELLGHVDPASSKGFTEILSEEGKHLNLYLREEAASAWKAMKKAAKPDGIDLDIVSATRNFDRQKVIWENKWEGRTAVNGTFFKNARKPGKMIKASEILKYSAMPGTSRHHWGTDIDINSVEDEYFETTEGINVYRWLKVNAFRFGFAQPYTEKNSVRAIGYEEEKWHWTYLKLSRNMLNQYLRKVDYKDIQGFAGAELAKDLHIISAFVCGINPECK